MLHAAHDCDRYFRKIQNLTRLSGIIVERSTMLKPRLRQQPPSPDDGTTEFTVRAQLYQWGEGGDRCPNQKQ